MSLETTPDLKSALRPAEISETARNNEDVALDNYDSDMIVVNISRSENERGKT